MFGHFAFDRLWSPGAPPLVDYVLGAKPRGGVFVVGHTDDAYQRRMLDWFPPESDQGRSYLLTRPYHLGAPGDDAHGAGGRADEALAAGAALRPATSDCYAKKPLAPGDRLDGPGGFSCYGLIENRGEAGEPGFPICLSHEARLKRTVARDERIAWTDVDEATIGPAALAAYRRTLSLAARPA